MPHSTRWLIDVTAGHTPLQSFYETASTEMGAIDKAKTKFRGIGAFGRVSEMGPLRFKATKVKANDRQGRQHATKKAPTAANAGRRDADIWMQETPEGAWADAIKPGVLGADESLINALGTAEAAKYLGVGIPYRNGKLTDAASKAFGEYARAYARRVSEALRSENASMRQHATKKKSAAQLDREINEVVPGWDKRRPSPKTRLHHAAKPMLAKVPDPKKTLKAIVELAFPQYKGRKIRLEESNGVERQVEGGGTFYRDFLVGLSHPFNVSQVSQPNAFRGSGTQRTTIPPGYAYVSQGVFQGKDTGIRIYLPPIDPSAMSVAVDVLLSAGKITPAVLPVIEDAIGKPGVIGLYRDAYVALAAQSAGQLATAEAKSAYG